MFSFVSEKYGYYTEQLSVPWKLQERAVIIMPCKNL